MSFRLTKAILFFVGCSAASVAFAAGKHPEVTIAPTVPYAADAKVPDAVRQDCELDKVFAEYLHDMLKDYRIPYRIAAGPLGDETGRVLEVEINHIHAPGGGGWSGPKSVTAVGKLREGEQVLGTFTASRFYTGGLFAKLKGNCSFLETSVKKLSQDIAKWATRPSMNAELGNR
jgi:hypothetical protein